MDGSLSLAFGAGMLATVSPCGLAMLPGFLAYYIGTDVTATQQATSRTAVMRRSVQGLRTGSLISIGFFSVFVATALVVTAGLRSVVEAIPWVAVAVGIVLVVVGTLMLAGRKVAMGLRFNPLRTGGRGPIAMIAYGAAYAVASLSCSLGVLLALIGTGLSASSMTSLLRTFAAFSAGSATILVLLALSAAMASGGLAKALQRSSRYATQAAGVIVVLSGIYMVAYWVPSLDGGSSNRGLAGKVMPTTGAIRDFFDAHTGVIGILAVSAIVVVVAWALLTSRRTASGIVVGDDAVDSDELVDSP